MSEVDLERFHREYPLGVDFTENLSLVAWPNTDPDLDAKWFALSDEAQETLSLNLNNTNAVALLTALGFDLEKNPEGYVTSISGRCSIAELKVRLSVAIRWANRAYEAHLKSPLKAPAVFGKDDPEYMLSRIEHLDAIVEMTEECGFTHLSWG